MQTADRPHRHRITLSRILGFTAVILSMVTLFNTALYNMQQGHLAACNAVITAETVRAIRARDEALLALFQSNQAARASDAQGQAAVAQYQTNLTRYASIIHHSPLPDASCLLR